MSNPQSEIRNPKFPLDIIFPEDAGILDVTKAPYNAKGDGIVDDTEALQKAIAQFPNGRAIVYLPRGTYLISDTLSWPGADNYSNAQKNIILQGQNREHTIIRLKDACDGFLHAENPKGLIWTGCAPAQRFRNAVRNLTFDTGNGNPGAIGMQFMANNQGCIREVTVRSNDGGGAIGIDMAYSDEIGPLLIKEVLVQGFDIGIKTGFTVDSMTMEHVRLENQRQYGFLNEGQCVNVRRLTSVNDVPAVRSREATSFLTLIETELRTKSAKAGCAAIVNESALFARDIRCDGYTISLDDRRANTTLPAGSIEEYTSHKPHALFPGVPEKSLRLPIKETPVVPWDDINEWVSPTHFGYVPESSEDVSEAVQKAIDSGKSTLYFPRGTYVMRKPVVVRANIRRIIGCEAGVMLENMDGPAFIIADGAHPVVIFERIQGNYNPIISLDNTSSRTLVISSCCDACGAFTGNGEIFIEDTCSSPVTNWQFNGQHVWARQFNPENSGTHILNNGGKLWILGLKTERNGILIETKNGGSTELLGGFNYCTSGEYDMPAFVNDNSAVSIVCGEANFKKSVRTILVREIRGEKQKDLTKDMLPPCNGNGSAIPLYRG